MPTAYLYYILFGFCFYAHRYDVELMKRTRYTAITAAREGTVFGIIFGTLGHQGKLKASGKPLCVPPYQDVLIPVSSCVYICMLCLCA